MDPPPARVQRTDEGDGAPPARADRRGIGTVVAASLTGGLATAILLPFLPWPAPSADVATAMVLFGFALGWALLAVLSRRTAHPQRWALAPAVFMTASATVVLLGSDPVLSALGWIWPPALVGLVVWIFVQARRDLHSRTRRWVLHPVLAVLLLVAIGGTYETVSRAREPSFTMSGKLVDIGPYRLHLECTGTGSPTVVLEPGGGASAATLGWIAPAVARETTVCVYDRAGRGWSDSAQVPPDATQIATDLHTLLDRAQVPGPYVLAGHSFGGLYVMTYAVRYPEEVSGMVLVDSTAPQHTSPPAELGTSYSFIKRLSVLVSTTARLGVGRLVASTSYADLPGASRDEARSSAATAKEMSSFIDEYAVAGRSAREAGTLHDLMDLPLTVLTADRGNAAGWEDAQDELATLSTNSRHLVVPGASHASLVEDEEHAAAVSTAILDVVDLVRQEAAQ
jgi:pimeloyl-ACP methyl ester carboxylesterase